MKTPRCERKPLLILYSQQLLLSVVASLFRHYTVVTSLHSILLSRPVRHPSWGVGGARVVHLIASAPGAENPSDATAVQSDAYRTDVRHYAVLMIASLKCASTSTFFHDTRAPLCHWFTVTRRQ